MKISFKATAAGVELVVGKERIPPERIAGFEFKAMPGGGLPHAVITLVPDEMEIDAAMAAVTQVQPEAVAAPPAQAPQPNRAARRKKK